MCFNRNKKSATQDNQQNQEELGLLLNKMAAWILFLCIVVAAVTVAFFSLDRAILDEEKEVKISYVFQTDTLGSVTPQSRALADSVLYEMSKHEQRIADKYEYIIEQRSNIEDYLTWGGILLTVVISIFGFFGYKSLHDIQERILKHVEPSAQKAAEDKAEEICGGKHDAYVTRTEAKIEAWKTTTETKIDSNQSEKFSSLKKDLTENIGRNIARQKQILEEQIRTRVKEEYNQNFADKAQEIKNNSDIINSLQADITTLMSRIDEVEEKIVTTSRERQNTKQTRGSDKREERVQTTSGQQRNKNKTGKSLVNYDPDPMNPKKS